MQRDLTIGIYNLEFAQLGGGERRSLVLAAHWRRRHRVVLITNRPLDLGQLERYFGVDLAGIEVVTLDDSVRTGPMSVHAANERWAELRALNLDVFVNQSFGSMVVNPAPRGIYMCMFPTPAVECSDQFAFPRASTERGGSRRNAPLASYDVITANSDFTARHVMERWSRPAVTVYSPCRSFAPGAKERSIVHVSRFQPYKRHDAIIDAFTSSTLHRQGWRLDLAGSSAGTPEMDAHIAALMARSDGFPIRLHVNLPNHELEALYASASIYWHATGFGTSEAMAPDAQEHFGQTVVEAMSAGAVPVVLATGGVVETVSDERDGLLCSDIDDLVRRSERLAGDPARIRQMAEAATVSSRRFSAEQFCIRMDRVLDSVVGARPGALLDRAIDH